MITYSTFMNDISTIINRLRKNKKSRKSLIKSEKTNAYRLYDRDIPEYPFIIDVYGNMAIIYEKGKKITDKTPELYQVQQKHKQEIQEAIQEVLELEKKNILFKIREQQKGKSQYTKNSRVNQYYTVHENEMNFLVNLTDYLDTGLFLDHRPLRKWIKSESKNKKVLNLFSYTGSISVAAALGGGKVTTIDMSKTYLNWAIQNFEKNNIDSSSHEFIQADALQYLSHDLEGVFDIIILDPPSFSNSKRMEQIFDVQEDHGELIEKLMHHLSQNGVLYFSNNFRKFSLNQDIREKYNIADISKRSIPLDFRDQKIHVCYKITHKS